MVVEEQKLHSCMKPFLGYCLYKAAQILKSKVEESIKSHQLVIQQFGILHLLNSAGTMNQSELAAAMEMDTASVVRFIDGLEKQKYVLRKSDPNDRRSRQLEVTEQGLKALSELQATSKEVEERFLRKLTADERKALKTIIPKLITDDEK